MRIDKAKYTIELDKSEIDTISFSLKHDMLQSIDHHYNNLQQGKDGEPVFDDYEKDKVRLLKELSALTGLQIYEDFEYQKKRLFEEKRKERESKK